MKIVHAEVVVVLENGDDAQAFKRVREALDGIGYEAEPVNVTMIALGGNLYLIEFATGSSQHENGDDAS